MTDKTDDNSKIDKTDKLNKKHVETAKPEFTVNKSNTKMLKLFKAMLGFATDQSIEINVKENKRIQQYHGKTYDLDKLQQKYYDKSIDKISTMLDYYVEYYELTAKPPNPEDIVDTSVGILSERWQASSYGTDVRVVDPLSPIDYANIVQLTFQFMLMFQSLGDTLGYKNGDWEFNNKNPGENFEYTNEMIYEFITLGGINDISIDNWRASDDTLMYMATYEVLLGDFKTIDEFGSRLREAYLKIVPDMEGRDPGETTIRSLDTQKNIKWDQIHYNNRDIGAGSAMRSGCIGIFYPGSHNRSRLIALATECSRITHNSATAIVGSIAAALFTAYAMEKVDITHWPHKFLKLLNTDAIDNYIKLTRPNDYSEFKLQKFEYTKKWQQYVDMRFSGTTEKTDPTLKRLMENPVSRIKHLATNFSKGHESNPGSCGDDVIILAYDALLQSKGVIEKLIVYGILNTGDSDTVGSIAMSWFGIVHFNYKNLDIVVSNFRKLEFFNKLWELTTEGIYKRLTKIINYDLVRHYAMKLVMKFVNKQKDIETEKRDPIKLKK